MSGKCYVIRRKVTKIKPTPIPESTYVPETFVQRSTVEPIKADPRMEELARPKPRNDDLGPPPEVPKYQNPPPSFEPVEFRVNEACLYREVYLMRQQAAKEAYEKETEPAQFLEWQAKMRSLDEEQRLEVIQQRHQELDGVRKRAMKAKKQRIAERLEEGNAMRLQFGKDFEAVQQEIEQEREKIRQLKAQLVDKAPAAAAKMKHDRIQATKEMKKQLRMELRDAQKRREDEIKAIKEQATTLREQAESHTMFKGDKYSAKVEITETTFLAALSDEEATALVKQHRELERARIESQIEEHRALKAQKMDRLVAMLDEATRVKDAREEVYMREKQEKQEAVEKAQKKKEAEDEQKMLELERKLDKKRKSRIKEAEDMEEHTRQIAARNRYLALNKKALATKVFQSQQDAKLRSAKERQMMKMPEDQQKIPMTKKSQAGDMKGLKSLLGL